MPAYGGGRGTALTPATPIPLGNLKSGYYYFLTGGPSTTTSAALTNALLRIAPYYIPNAVTLTKIGCEVATTPGEAGSKVRLGIWADDGAGYPGSLILDAGQIAGDAVAVAELTISQALGPGMYWFGAVCQSAPTTQPTLRCSTQPSVAYTPIGTSAPTASYGTQCLYQASVTGALGAFTGTAGTNLMPRIHVKVT